MSLKSIVMQNIFKKPKTLEYRVKELEKRMKNAETTLNTHQKLHEQIEVLITDLVIVVGKILGYLIKKELEPCPCQKKKK